MTILFPRLSLPLRCIRCWTRASGGDIRRYRVPRAELLVPQGTYQQGHITSHHIKSHRMPACRLLRMSSIVIVILCMLLFVLVIVGIRLDFSREILSP